MNEDQRIREESERSADPRIDLAVERTRLAMERTQLAWVRTVVGLITAGVAIDKGFEALHEARMVAGTAWVSSGHFAGRPLTIVGTVLMTIVTGLYVVRMGALDRMRGRRSRVPEPGTLLSVFICLLGALAIYFLSLEW
jgi:putative membrane protein